MMDTFGTNDHFADHQIDKLFNHLTVHMSEHDVSEVLDAGLQRISKYCPSATSQEVRAAVAAKARILTGLPIPDSLEVNR